MKRHIDPISKNPRVDVERVRNIRYLYEFDRYGLYSNSYSQAKPVTESFKAPLGDTPPKGHTTVTHRPVTRY